MVWPHWQYIISPVPDYVQRRIHNQHGGEYRYEGLSYVVWNRGIVLLS